MSNNFQAKPILETLVPKAQISLTKFENYENYLDS